MRKRYTLKRSCFLLIVAVVILGIALAVMINQLNVTMTPAMDNALYQMQTQVRSTP
jgi:hypothetical protein